MLSKLNMVERFLTVPTEKTTKQPHLNPETLPSVPCPQSPRPLQLLQNNNHKPGESDRGGRLSTGLLFNQCRSKQVIPTRYLRRDFDGWLAAAEGNHRRYVAHRSDGGSESNGVSLPVNEIVTISYALEPVELKTARRLTGARDFDGALKRLDEIKATEISRDLISQDVDYYKAYSIARLALGGKGDKDAAIKTL